MALLFLQLGDDVGKWQGLQERISKGVRTTHWQLGKSAEGEVTQSMVMLF